VVCSLTVRKEGKLHEVFELARFPNDRQDLTIALRMPRTCDEHRCLRFTKWRHALDEGLETFDLYYPFVQVTCPPSCNNRPLRSQIFITTDNW
jgi:hypothetical protein